MTFMKLIALGAAALLACAPAAAQNIATLPNAATLTGAEKMPAAQGTGCPTKVQPCASVAISPAAIGTYLAPTFQPKDADLDAIAALATQPLGRSLLAQADAAAVRSVIGLGSVATYATGVSGTTVPLLSGLNIWSAAQTIDGGNRTNTQTLILQNVGEGTSGITVRRASGGELTFGNGVGPSWQIYSPNRTLQIAVDNAAYDSAPQALLFSNASALTRTVVRLKQVTAGSTGNFLEAVDNANTVRFSVSSAGSVLATRLCYSATVCDYAGSGTPAGNVSAGIGSTYRRTDGGAGATFYVKESGTDASGWVAK